MITLEKIVESLKTMPESAQTDVLDYVEYLKSEEERGGNGCQWTQFSLESAMHGIAEEPTSYEVQDIKEKF
jgi:hypothetical protein